MPKRRAIDFTCNCSIEVCQSLATGRYWAQINDEQGLAWQMQGDTDCRSEAFDLACNRLDALAEAYVSEGEQEPEDDGAGISEQQHCQRNGVPWCQRP